MKVCKNVRSTIEKPNMYFDDAHVYVVEGQKKVEENVGEDNEFIGYEVETEYEYEKDEFLQALYSGQIELGTRTTAMEDMILEMSEVVYA